jgi:hypothetical protein
MERSVTNYILSRWRKAGSKEVASTVGIWGIVESRVDFVVNVVDIGTGVNQ